MANKIIGYHYTNEKAYQSMQRKGVEGWITFNFDEFTGLIPQRRFLNLSRGKNLPDEAYEGIIEGLLEPEPKSWTENSEFPRFFGYLMHDICRTGKVLLLSFELKPSDKAYVVERAHIERELYREYKGQGPSTRKTMNESAKKYWESRVPVFEYNKNYHAPQLAIWSGIEFERLNIEWIKESNKVWKRVLTNHWY
jgi:hypothetical protein